jgi:two-component system NarL family sensor kinase
LDIKLKKEDSGFVLIFKDNGKGFDIDIATKKMGLGLQNINSRVSILSGYLTIESSKTTGSAFTINCKFYAA